GGEILAADDIDVQRHAEPGDVDRRRQLQILVQPGRNADRPRYRGPERLPLRCEPRQAGVRLILGTGVIVALELGAEDQEHVAVCEIDPVLYEEVPGAVRTRGGIEGREGRIRQLVTATAQPCPPDQLVPAENRQVVLKVDVPRVPL